jgi:hypothetical protein
MRLLAVLAILLQLISSILDPGPLQVVSAQTEDPANVLDAGSQAIFGGDILFRAVLQPPTDIDEVLVSFTPQNQVTHLEKMTLGMDGTAQYTIQAGQLALAPFTRIDYKFEVRYRNGKKIESQPYQLSYDDTRFTWQAQDNGIFQVHWNGEDSTLGQEILNVAQTGLEQAQSFLQVDPPNPIRIYAYSSSKDMQDALTITGSPWVAGHASPELGLIMISIPSGPEKKLELQRQIPHEIMHLLQYKITGKNFTRQPVWLVEGMASLAELYPNPEYKRVLEDTAKADGLIPMDTLCASFPNEAGPAFRAYAQSESFVRFLYATYGNSGLLNLIKQYQNGLGCTEAVEAAFGTSLGQLEFRWKQNVLGLNAGGLAARRLSPYLFLGLLLIIPLFFTIRPLRAAKKKAATRPTGEEP